MRPPGFWSRDPNHPGLRARLLTPLSWIIARVARARGRQPGWRAGMPVICVGNLTIGGTGKTPTVIALTQILLERGYHPHLLSRGYPVRSSGVVRVNPARHTALDVGDEPLLLAAFAPTWVAADRAAAARAAIDSGADVLVMDDGFQNPGLRKDLSIIVVDTEQAFGNGRVLPAGPLREPLTAGLARADLLLAVGGHSISAPTTLPIMTGHLHALETGIDWADMPVFAFAGIGRPGKMFQTLRALDADVRGTVALGDHQSLTPALLTRLERDAQGLGAQLVTTEKDAVRLPAAWRSKILTLPVRMAFDDAAPLEAALDALLT